AARPCGPRRAPRGTRLRGRLEALGRALRGDARAGGAAAPGAGAVHAGPAHARARLHRGIRAVPGAGPGAHRHRATAEVRAGSVRGARRAGFLPHPDRRGAPHQPGARADRARGSVAAEMGGAHAVFPFRGGRGRQGHARHDPQPPVRQGGAGAGRAAGGFVRRARGADRARGSGAAPARDSVPHRGAVRGRCRLQQRQDLRSGSMAAVAAALSRDLLVQQLRGLPGAPHARALAQSARRQARSRAHPEWLGTRGRAHAGGGARELPEPGRFGRRAGGAAALHGRAHGTRALASPRGIDYRLSIALYCKQMKRPARRPRAASARDPLFNSSVQKALGMLESFGGERRERSLAELALGAGMTVSSAQRCTHTLVRLGFLRRDARARRWVLTPRVLSLTAAYLSGHALLEQATTHLIDLNQASGESVRIAAARAAGYAWSDQECYRGDLTIAAAVLGADGQPLAAVNISAPTSRWTLAELRSKLAPLLLQTARAAWQGDLPPPRRP